MSNAPSITVRFARAVRTRMRLRRCSAGAGWGLLAGASAGLVAVVLARFTSLPDPWWRGVGALVLLGGLVGGVATLFRPIPLASAARFADRALGLKDRLSSALSFSRSGNATPSMALAIADAEKAAARSRASAVVSLRLGRVWAVWPMVAAAAVSAGLWLPERVMSSPSQEPAVATESERRTAADAVASAARQAREAVAGLDERGATSDELDRLSEIERELIDGERDPREADAAAARAIERAAERLAAEAAEAELTDQSLKRDIAELLQNTPTESALMDALAKGDLRGARDAAEAMLDRADQLSPEERARLAEQLDALAEQLDAADTQTAEADEPDAEPAAGAADQPAEESAEQTRERLEREGLDPAAAERRAEELAEEKRRERAEDQAREDARELSESAREAADELRREPEEPSPPPDEGDQPQGDQPQGDQPQGDQPQDDPSQEGTDPDTGEQTPSDDPNAESQDPQERGEPGEEGEARESSESGESGESGQPEDVREERTEGGENEQGTQEGSGDPDEAQPTEPRQGDPEGQQPESGQAPKGGEGEGAPEDPSQPGQPSGADPSAPEQGSETQPGSEPGERGVERFRRQMERMAERSQRSDRQRQASERLREQAERLLEDASPEERRELERLAGGLAGEGDAPSEPDAPPAGGPFQTEPVDARGEPGQGDEGPGRVIGDWLDPGADRPASGTGGADGAEFRDAVRGAQRAIERQAVPRSREDLVRRVFERYRQRSGEESSDGAGGG